MKGVAGADEPAEVISIPNLIKHLCTLVAQPEVDRVVHLPSYRRKVINNFLNIAYEQLLGLRPEEAPEINDTDDLDHLVADGLSTVTSALHSDGFPELAASLASLLHRLSACTSCTVTGTPLQTITGKPPVVRMPDRTSLLTFLLELQGTCPSVRRRQSSFQQAWEARQLEKTSVEYDPMHITLRSNVFSEAPDPEALFHVSGTSVLLPQEGGGASAAAVGDADQLADLDTCLETRPVWAPTAAEGLPTKQGGGWLPIPHSLAQLQGDPRRHAPATPLRVPIGVLATDASPGAGTAFQAFKDQQTGTSPSVSRPLSARKPGQGSPIKVAAAARRQAAAEQEEAARRKAACSRGMWTGEEIDLARDAILSLQGVHSALMRLHGVLAAPHALPRPAAAGLLRSVQRAARVRQGLESFVAAHSGTGYVSGRMEVFNTDVTGEEGTSSAPGPGYDPVLVAFASAVGDLLRQLTEELSSLELLDGGSTSGGAPGPSLLHVAAGTREVQAELHTLGTLCWCTQAPGSAGLWTWEVTPPPTGTALLQYLYHQEQAAEGKLHTMVQYLFLRAVQPYTHALHRCAFTTSCLTGEDVYLTYAPPGWLDLGPSEAASSEQSGLRRRRRATLVPGPLPAFLADWQGPLLHASSQLRLLQTVECARDFVATLLALAPPPVALVQGSKSSREDGRWLLLGQSALDPGHGSVQGMSSEALHAAIASAAVDDAARAEAVDTWLEGLAKDRKEAENRERRAALDVLERLRGERVAVESSRLEALERRRSSKAALLQDQLQALAETRYIRANGAFTHPGARSDPVSGIQGIELPGKELLEEPDQDGAALSHMLAHPSSDGAVNGEADLPSSAPQMPSYEVNNGVISSTGAQENFRHWRSTACASVPMLLETTLGRALVSHSLAVSRACVGLFVDHLSLLRHLKFLRRAFFLEAGDWGDAFLAPLAERVDGLQPLTGQVLHVALQDAIRASSLEGDDFASTLQVDLLPGATAPSTFLSSMKEDPGSAASLPQLPRGRALAPALIAPGRLDGLDCILLQYPVHWPLAAVMEEDCLVGYAAVFNAMLRVRRVQLVLRRLHAAVHARSRSRPRQAPRTAHGDALYKDLGGKAVEAAEALVGAPPGEVERRLQQLRAFTHAALHLVSAIQRFQGVCTTGHGWDSLARKVAPDGPHNSRPANAQEIIDLHRAYVRRAAGDVLTFCGDAAVLEAAEAALGAALDVAGKVQAAVESSGASHVAHSAWVRELAASGTWRLILGGMETFGGAWGRMKEALGQASRGAAPLNHLSVLLDS